MMSPDRAAWHGWTSLGGAHRLALAGCNSLDGPGERRIGTGPVGFPIEIRAPHRLLQPGSIGVAKGRDVFGLRSFLAGVRRPVVLERGEFHAVAEQRLGDLLQTGIA